MGLKASIAIFTSFVDLALVVDLALADLNLYHHIPLLTGSPAKPMIP
jgi:hypothetical protein